MKKSLGFLLILALLAALALPACAAEDDPLLTLVNPWNTLPEGWTVDLVSVGGGHKVDKTCYDDLTAMLEACKTAVKEELAAEEPSVIISRRPCALLKYVKHKKPIIADSDKCVGCKACMKIGCPAISIIDGKAKVDATQCVGCGVCEQLCKFGALTEV